MCTRVNARKEQQYSTKHYICTRADLHCTAKCNTVSSFARVLGAVSFVLAVILEFVPALHVCVEVLELLITRYSIQSRLYFSLFFGRSFSNILQ